MFSLTGPKRYDALSEPDERYRLASCSDAKDPVVQQLVEKHRRDGPRNGGSDARASELENPEDVLVRQGDADRVVQGRWRLVEHHPRRRVCVRVPDRLLNHFFNERAYGKRF